VLAALLAASPDAEARRQVSLVVAAVQNYADQRHLTSFCLARGSEDPEAAVLEGLRAQDLKPKPASACVGKDATGMQLTYEVNPAKKNVGSVRVEAASLPDRQSLGRCLYTFTWRKNAWELPEPAVCSGY
jgi:hypothetical protein